VRRDGSGPLPSANRVEGRPGQYIRIKLYGRERDPDSQACECVALGEHLLEDSAFSAASTDDVIRDGCERVLVVKVIGVVTRGVQVQR
jgi:hypothetical protein